MAILAESNCRYVKRNDIYDNRYKIVLHNKL